MSTWKRGISAGRQSLRPPAPKQVGRPAPHKQPGAPCTLTNLDWEAWWQAQGDEVTQFGKVGIADGHQVDDGRHLVTQGQRVLLTQPQGGLEPVRQTTGPHPWCLHLDLYLAWVAPSPSCVLDLSCPQTPASPQVKSLTARGRWGWASGFCQAQPFLPTHSWPGPPSLSHSRWCSPGSGLPGSDQLPHKLSKPHGPWGSAVPARRSLGDDRSDPPSRQGDSKESSYRGGSCRWGQVLMSQRQEVAGPSICYKLAPKTLA